ncbi:SpoIIE family protein phosphatase [Streptomyces sp. WI04-05B]|nr:MULTISPECIES: SpoIIE family protein phosphatase [unclassified Streptomyces]MDX2542267.1 SpoIIE family protein phosphatase [Streptomyces sp. WI04-05B]MDX2584099.1 SpoIIE family protein phosphatase [Streptomyces sp. WI04-05A]MDX3751199.1 SpoIIE family protein phosphatase [Streptomyces sp. AK08-02]
MDSTRVTEQPTSHERPRPGTGRPDIPADTRGALLRSPEAAALPLPKQTTGQKGAAGAPEAAVCPGTGSESPETVGGAATTAHDAGTSGTEAGTGAMASSSGTGTGTSGSKGPNPAGPPATPGPEHSQSDQPSSTEPDAHRPRPAPDGIPVQPGAETGRPGTENHTTEHHATETHPSPNGPAEGDSADPAASDLAGRERRSGQGSTAGTPLPMRRDGDRLRFVGAATRRIARGIDLDEIVMGLCRATVPTFSDTILVYLRDPLPVGDERPTGPLVLRLRRTDRLPQERDTENGFLATSAVPQPLPELSPVSAELCEVRPGGALAEVLRGVRPVFADAPAARAALPELLGESCDLEVPDGQRAILAPLRGRRRVIGAALFLRRPDRIPFETDDLLVAAQLATHSALGIDKAVLYGREAYIADELQRTMLPETLPRPTGVRLASRYLPAAETARVGGDWYDAIPLPGSRVALVVGDVMGHSMTSAAIMGQLRTTAQTLAGLDLPPQEVLHHLDEQAQRLGTDRMATCLYAVYDPVSHRITIANAGHPPPVLLHLGGRAEVLKVPSGAPIGVGGVDFEAVELDAPAGATLFLYTDGLVESRLRDVWTGIEQLREKLAATAQLTGPDHPPPLEALCDEVLDMLGPGDRDDDIALLAARFDGIAPSDVAYWYLDPEDAAPGRARRLARRALSRWGLEEMTDSVELLVSEVVTNAVRYASRPITLRLLRTDVLRCEVGDDVPQLPRLRQARATDEGGRGLYLVNRLARRWGATRLSTGKVVWFELGRT